MTPPEKGIAVGETVINLKAIEDWKKQKLSWLNEDENLSSIDQIKKFLMLEISKLSIHQDLSKLRPDNIIKKIGGKRKSLNSKLLERLQKEVFNENKELPVLFEKISNCYEEFNEISSIISLVDLKRFAVFLSTKNKVIKLVELYLLLSDKSHGEVRGVRDIINSLKEDDLVLYSDRNDVLIPKCFSLLENHLNEDIINSIANDIHKNILNFSNQRSTRQSFATQAIKLIQVPPEIAIFRGNIGDDCSSRYSFAIPYDPHEMVFFIKDKNEKIKGFVSATVVSYENTSALYVITISGSKISRGDTELIFMALEKEKRNLGVEHILLPETYSLNKLINWPSIKSCYESINKGKEAKPFSYKNPDIRTIVEQFWSSYNSATYDHMQENKKAIIYSRISGDLHLLKTKTVEINKPYFHGLDKIDNAKLLKFLFEMSSIHPAMDFFPPAIARRINVAGFNRVNQILQLSFDKIDNAKLLVESIKDKTVAEFIEEIKNYFIAVNAETIYSDSMLFPAIMLCKDAFSEENKDFTAQLAVNQLIQSDLEKHLVWIQKEQQLFKSKIFRNFFMEEIKLFIQTKPTDARYRRLENFLSKMNYSPLEFNVQGIVSKINKGHFPVQPLEKPFIEEMLIVYHMNKLHSYLANGCDISWVKAEVRQLTSIFNGREIPLNHLIKLIDLEINSHYDKSGEIIDELINNICPNVVERLSEIIIQKGMENINLKFGALRSLSFYIPSRDMVLSSEVMNEPIRK